MQEQDLATEVRDHMGAMNDFMKTYGAKVDDMGKTLKGVDSDLFKVKQLAMGGTPVGGGGRSKAQTLGSKFVASSIYKVFIDKHQDKSDKFVLAAAELVTSALLAPPFPVFPTRIDDATNVYATLTVRSVLNPRPIKGGAIEYLRQKPTTGTAGIQWPQGTRKAEIALDFEAAQANIATTAAFAKTSRQIAEDEAQVEAIIDGELMHAIYLKEELEILNGDGSAGHMAGLLTLAPTFTGGAGTSPIDIIGQAIGQIAALGYKVTATMVNPVDWTAMLQAKTEGGGEYLIGSPGAGATSPTLWNIPVIPSSNIVAGTFLTGSFGVAAQLFDRETRLDVADQNEADFVENLLCFLGEIRSALVVRRPQGFLQGSLVTP